MASTNEIDFDDLRRAATEMIAELRDSGAVPGIAIGERAPNFVLPDATGSKVSLEERLTSGPVVVSFYRGAWCPYCSTELQGLQGSLDEIAKRGASVIAISPQAPDASLTLVERHKLAFDVLSDLDQAVSVAYQLQFELSPALQAIYPQLGMDLAQHNADGSWNLAVPATFVIDTEGVVRARHVDPNYTERMPMSDILAALDDLS